MKIKRELLIIVLSLGVPVLLSAQTYIDDDIYYNASKATQKTTIKAQTNNVSKVYYVVPNDADYSDESSLLAYSDFSTSTRDVDEYNRRGNYGNSASTSADSVQDDTFKYTRRIEKYYNPTIIVASGDSVLAEYYYDSDPQINIIVNTPSYWDWWYPYSRWSLAWTWGSPWYWSSWYWGWDPFWSWAGWWGPIWHHHYYPRFWGYGGFHHAWRPSRGAYRPHGVGIGQSRQGVGYRGGNNRSSSLNNSTRRSSSSSSRSGNVGNTSNNRNNGSSYSRPSGNTSRGGSSGRSMGSGGGGRSMGSGGGRSIGGGSHGGRR